ncbi:MAG: hypothetical protein WCO09_00725, partial [bacterium]
GLTDSHVYTNPYAFVFGYNPVGLMDFKILTIGQSSTPLIKFGTILGVSESATTLLNLKNIENTPNSGSASNTGGVSSQDSTSSDNFDDSIMYAEIDAALDGAVAQSTSGGSGDSTCLDGNFGSGSGANSCPTKSGPVPQNVAGVVVETFQSIKDLQNQLVSLAKNTPSSGLCAKWETGYVAVRTDDGNVEAAFEDGDGGAVNLDASLSYILNKYANKISAIYVAHAHDDNSLKQIRKKIADECYSSANENEAVEVADPYVIPSEGDFYQNYKWQSKYPNIKIIERVFASSGNGYEFSVTQGSDMWNTLAGGTRSLGLDVVRWDQEEKALVRNNHHWVTVGDVHEGILAAVKKLKSDWGVTLNEVTASTQ